MKIVKHIFQQPFVAATGAAALVHSTWALGTLFAGEQPQGWALLGWLVPALLIAFALDVGQIVTSAEIRQRGLTIQRGVTFLVFAFATYYLQWLYIAHHMPALEIAAGVSAIAKETAISMRDAALWIIPALLPLATLLYTFSSDQPGEVAVLPEQPVQPEMSDVLHIESVEPGAATPAAQLEPGEHDVSCPDCNWQRSYKTAASARLGLTAHKQHCKGKLVAISNGHERS